MPALWPETAAQHDGGATLPGWIWPAERDPRPALHRIDIERHIRDPAPGRHHSRRSTA